MSTDPSVSDIAVDFIDPISEKPSFIQSRLAILPNGTCIPVLTFLAERKFGSWDRATAFPFWIDGDPSNETSENIALAKREPQERHTYGLSGPSYQKQYREALRIRYEELRKQRRRNVSVRDLLKKG